MRSRRRVPSWLMNLANALLQIAKRADLDADKAHPATGQAALTVLIGLGVTPYWEGRVVRSVLAGLCNPDVDPELSRADLDSLSPVAVGAICRLVDAVMNGEMAEEDLVTLLGVELNP